MGRSISHSKRIYQAVHRAALISVQSGSSPEEVAKLCDVDPVYMGHIVAALKLHDAARKVVNERVVIPGALSSALSSGLGEDVWLRIHSLSAERGVVGRRHVTHAMHGGMPPHFRVAMLKALAAHEGDSPGPVGIMAIIGESLDIGQSRVRTLLRCEEFKKTTGALAEALWDEAHKPAMVAPEPDRLGNVLAFDQAIKRNHNARLSVALRDIGSLAVELGRLIGEVAQISADLQGEASSAKQ